MGCKFRTLVIDPSSFRALFCARHRCRDHAYERALFWRGLYPHAVPLAALIRLFAPDFFHDDRALIADLGRDLTMEEVADDLDRFEYGNRVRRHWLRTGFRIHLSSHRVARLARMCLD